MKRWALIAILAIACSRQAPSPAEVFSDELSGFTLTKPEGWYMQGGEALREPTQEEARRFKDPRLATLAGAAWESLMRITRFPPGQAPGPNPTIVLVRFDLSEFPPDTDADELLRMGFASAQIEEEPTTVELGGRPWRKVTAARLLSRPPGLPVRVVQEAYVTADSTWALGLTITATREQYPEYRSAFDVILGSIRFQ